MRKEASDRYDKEEAAEKQKALVNSVVEALSTVDCLGPKWDPTMFRSIPGRFILDKMKDYNRHMSIKLRAAAAAQEQPTPQVNMCLFVGHQW